MFLIHFATEVPSLFRVEFMKKPCRAQEIIWEEILLVEFLIIWRSLHICSYQVCCLFVELNLGPNIFRFRNTCALHYKASKILNATSIIPLLEGVFVREEDRVAMWMWWKPYIYIFLCLLVYNCLLLWRFAFLHLQVLHYTHSLIGCEDNSAVINIHCLLYSFIE